MDLSKDDVGLRIKKIRKLLKINQEDFLKCLNIKETSLSHYETGKKYPPFEFIIDIAIHYNVNVEYLVLGKGEPFMSEERDFDNLSNKKLFGDFTDDVKEMLSYMKRSKWALSVVNAHFKEYLLKNRKIIEKDIQETEEKRRNNES